MVLVKNTGNGVNAEECHGDKHKIFWNMLADNDLLERPQNTWKKCRKISDDLQ